MIDFACPQCGRKLRVKDDRAGQKAKCPHCAAALLVPSGAVAENASSPSRSVASEDATVPPKESAVVSEAPRDTHGEADATGGAKTGPPSELTDFLAAPQGPGEIGRLGPYRILKVLGAGGMGVVYQAEDPGLQRLIALKAMLPMLAVSATARERFLREARSAAAVEHDNIVAIYQVGEDRGVPYLAMPFLKGEPLDARLKREKRLPTAEVLRIARETATGLEAARQRGMIHRDIKPANLWLEEGTGRVKILDFGLARTTDDAANLTQQGAILGTPSYMAPEQAGGKADHRADLFSLACVMYRMSTGELPFKGADTISTLMAVATEPARPPIDHNPRMPPALSELILRLLAKKPEERPASAQAVVEAIRAIEANPRATVQLPPPPPPAAAPARSGPQRLGSAPAAVQKVRSGPQRLGVAAGPKSTAVSRGARTAARPPAPPRKSGGGALICGLVALLLLAGLAVGGYFAWPYLPFNSPASPSSSSDPASPPKDKPDPPKPPAPVVDVDASWHPLFNGEDTKNWTILHSMAEKNWTVEKGENGDPPMLTTQGLDKSWLLTNTTYRDFELRLQYRATPHADSGVAVHIPPKAIDPKNNGLLDPSRDGMEIQILDVTFGKNEPRVSIKPTETTGSLWDVAPADKPSPHPAGSWNDLDITVKGRRITVQLNGATVLNVDLDALEKDAVGVHPGLHHLNIRGHIGLQSHIGRVDFRKIEVRRINPDQDEPKGP